MRSLFPNNNSLFNYLDQTDPLFDPFANFRPADEAFSSATTAAMVVTASATAQGAAATSNTGVKAAVAPLSDMLARETGGVLTYSGALAVLQDAAASPMTASLFSQLTAATKYLNVAGGVAASAYVQQAFDDVVLGNSANAQWNGGANAAVALGNLSASSTQTQFNELIGKWFLGTDLPGVGVAPGVGGFYATSYKTYSLPLFSGGAPKLIDVNQGQVGDCWYVSALGETAMLDPTLIEHLITANGNGTYSVEFQVNGKADYVTVNSQLSTYNYLAQYSGSSMEFGNSTQSLWVPLFEKALAQLSEQTGITTGMQYAGGQDQYYELNSGMGEGVTLLTGQACNAYALGGKSGASLTSLLGQMQSDLAAGNDVLLGTSPLAVSGNLIASHMFAVTSVNAAAGTIGLFNPWGAAALGVGKAESFTIGASALVADQSCFYAASGHATVC